MIYTSRHHDTVQFRSSHIGSKHYVQVFYKGAIPFSTTHKPVQSIRRTIEEMEFQLSFNHYTVHALQDLQANLNVVWENME